MKGPHELKGYRDTQDNSRRGEMKTLKSLKKTSEGETG